MATPDQPSLNRRLDLHLLAAGASGRPLRRRSVASAALVQPQSHSVRLPAARRLIVASTRAPRTSQITTSGPRASLADKGYHDAPPGSPGSVMVPPKVQSGRIRNPARARTARAILLPKLRSIGRYGNGATGSSSWTPGKRAPGAKTLLPPRAWLNVGHHRELVAHSARLCWPGPRS
jgi:hypothetical protein